jgi:hypothetical protein
MPDFQLSSAQFNIFLVGVLVVDLGAASNSSLVNVHNSHEHEKLTTYPEAFS